jgi:hypothetical protein
MPDRNATPGRRSPAPLNYRRRLLAIVNAFLEPADPTHARADRLVDRLYHDPRRRLQFGQTVNELIWGDLISQLTDFVFYEQPGYLQETRNTLLHGSSELHRAYLCYDFRDQFSGVEREWRDRASTLAQWLQSSQFTDPDALLAEYERQTTPIKELSARSPLPKNLGDETLYHLLLRMASDVICGINPRYSARFGYLATSVPWTLMQCPMADERVHPCPDAGPSVVWAERALRAIVAEDWVWMTWQVTDKAYLVSLH